MKKIIIAVLTLLSMIASASANEAVITERFSGYWDAYASADFSKAADFMLPADLDAIKAEILPVFLAASKSGDQDVVDIAEYFFSNVPSEHRASLTPVQVFSRMNSLVFAMSPELPALLGMSSLEVLNIQSKAKNLVELNYALNVDEGSMRDKARLMQFNDQWYVCLNDDAGTTAAGFRELLGL